MTAPTDDREGPIPPALQRDLRRTLGREVRIPAELDAVLAAAARRSRRPTLLRPRLWAAAAAAALLLALPFVLTPAGRVQHEPLAREDFDQNGRVDVLDAFRLSLALQRHAAVPSTLDLDGDGQIDRRDVDLIAARAVAIHG